MQTETKREKAKLHTHTRYKFMVYVPHKLSYCS